MPRHLDDFLRSAFLSKDGKKITSNGRGGANRAGDSGFGFFRHEAEDIGYLDVRGRKLVGQWLGSMG